MFRAKKLTIKIISGALTAAMLLTTCGILEEGEDLPSEESVIVPGGLVVSENTQSGLISLSSFTSEEDCVITSMTDAISSEQLYVDTPDGYNEIDWSVKWANPSHEWAVGKDVSDYVIVTPSADDWHEATADCIAEFGEPVIITVTRWDTCESSSILCNYLARVAGAVAYFTKEKTLNFNETTYGGLILDGDSHFLLCSAILSNTYTLLGELKVTRVALNPLSSTTFLTALNNLSSNQYLKDVQSIGYQVTAASQNRISLFFTGAISNALSGYNAEIAKLVFCCDLTFCLGNFFWYNGQIGETFYRDMQTRYPPVAQRLQWAVYQSIGTLRPTSFLVSFEYSYQGEIIWQQEDATVPTRCMGFDYSNVSIPPEAA